MIGDILQPTHLLFILVIALLVLGPKRLPEVGRALGRGLRDFRNALNTDDLRDQMLSPTSTQSTTPLYDQPTTQDETPLHSESDPVHTETLVHTETPLNTETPLHSEPDPVHTAAPPNAEPTPTPADEPGGASAPTDVTPEPAVPTASHQPASSAPTDPAS